MSELELSPCFQRPDTSVLPPGWIAKQLNEFCSFFQGGRLGLTKSANYNSYGVPAYSAAGQDGYVDQAEFHGVSAVILSSIGANCGRCFYAEGDWSTLANVLVIVPDDTLSTKFLFYRVNRDDYWTKSGSAQPFIKPSSVGKSWVAFPKDKNKQKKIARILQTIDRAIEKTEALIEKYQQIKAGLMHDLFTRGIGPDGQLRPPREQAPELYQETPIGWIPKEWEARQLKDILAQSGGHLQTGPFGSQLHSHEYTEDGVPVVMPQDINNGKIEEIQVARISEARAERLLKHRLRKGDIILARRGELSRAAAVSEYEQNWVCGTGCFLLRLGASELDARFFSMVYRDPMIQRQVAGLAIGSTMASLNNEIMGKLFFPYLSSSEQTSIADRVNTVEQRIAALRSEVDKLQKQKFGLMRDLLTGKVPVQAEPESEPEAAHV